MPKTQRSPPRCAPWSVPPKACHGESKRGQFDAIMESVLPRDDVTIEVATLGGIPGIWVHPANWRRDEAILHLHGGWFNFGSAKAYRHLVGHIATRTGARAFIPDYRLAPQQPFPAATASGLPFYRGHSRYRRSPRALRRPSP